MVIRIVTDLGPEAARIIAKFEAGKKRVYIWNIFDNCTEPGYRTYIYTTNGRRPECQGVVVKT